MPGNSNKHRGKNKTSGSQQKVSLVTGSAMTALHYNRTASLDVRNGREALELHATVQQQMTVVGQSNRPRGTSPVVNSHVVSAMNFCLEPPALNPELVRLLGTVVVGPQPAPQQRRSQFEHLFLRSMVDLESVVFDINVRHFWGPIFANLCFFFQCFDKFSEESAEQRWS